MLPFPCFLPFLEQSSIVSKRSRPNAKVPMCCRLFHVFSLCWDIFQIFRPNVHCKCTSAYVLPRFLCFLPLLRTFSRSPKIFRPNVKVPMCCRLFHVTDTGDTLSICTFIFHLLCHNILIRVMFIVS